MVEHQKIKPALVVDTSFLLTCLLGDKDVPGKKDDIGLLKIVLDLARSGKFSVVVPDVVAAEFIGPHMPLQEKHFRKGSQDKLSSKDVMVGYAKAEERVYFLEQLLASGNGYIVETRAGGELLNNLKTHENTKDEFSKIKSKIEENARKNKWDIVKTEEEVDKALLKEMLKYNSLHRLVKDAAIRKDRGEVAMGDAIQMLRNYEQESSPVFVLYEGNDVRVRMIQRLLNPDDKQEGIIKDRTINPHYEQFDPKKVAHMENVNFVTTFGFLIPFMEMAEKQKKTFALHSEGKNFHTQRETYARIIENVNEHHLSRSYNAAKDVAAQDMQGAVKHEHEQLTQIASPWRKLLQEKEMMKLGVEMVESRDIQIRKDAAERAVELLKEAMRNWKQSGGDMSVMNLTYARMQERNEQIFKNGNGNDGISYLS